MYKILILLLIFCVSCSDENVGTATSQWYNTCQQIWHYSDIKNCINVSFWRCQDGSERLEVIPALGSAGIGTMCYHELDRTYYYICDLNEKGEAWVHCDYPGEP